MNKSSFLYFLLSSSTIIVPTQSAIWINGPEDRFFCGYKWDDDNCQSRQHCPTGRSEECEGNEDGIKCFANTNCDTRHGDGDWFVSGETVPNQSSGGSSRPTYTGKSPLKTDHYWCGVNQNTTEDQVGVQSINLLVILVVLYLRHLRQLLDVNRMGQEIFQRIESY